MEFKKMNIGVGITGSFCTFEKMLDILKLLKEKEANVIPIMSYNAFNIDTRFGKAEDYIKKVEEICNQKVLSKIEQVEPIGPKNLLDIFLILPCTGNTLSKLSNSISDTPVTCAAKSQLRNNKPVVLAVSTNDGLSGNAKNIGNLLNYKNIYFVPFKQDDAINKPRSLMFDKEKVLETLEYANKKIQIQPIIY